jgi:histone deacetylase HOS3
MEALGNKDAPTPPPSGANALFFLQDACLNHKYIRSRDASHIVERPERIRAVKAGLAVAISRLEELFASSPSAQNDQDDLVAALDRMNLANSIASDKIPLKIINSSASTNILNDPAVKFIHGDVDGDVYLENLIRWATESENKIVKGESEVPEELPQNDLYRVFAFFVGTYVDLTVDSFPSLVTSNQWRYRDRL